MAQATSRKLTRSTSTLNGKDPLGLIGNDQLGMGLSPRQWLVDGVVACNQTGVIGGPKKALKTSLAVDMAISVSSGTPFLGGFAVPVRRNVAYFSGETDQATMHEIALRVCRARQIQLSECAMHWSFSVSCFGQARALNDLDWFIRQKSIEMVVIDPLYLYLINRNFQVDTGNIYLMGPLLHEVEQVCLAAGAAPIFVHATTKNSSRSMGHLDLDDLSQSGIGECARQWMLVSRRTPYIGSKGIHHLQLAIGGSIGHSRLIDVEVDDGRLTPDLADRKWEITIKN